MPGLRASTPQEIIRRHLVDQDEAAIRPSHGYDPAGQLSGGNRTRPEKLPVRVAVADVDNTGGLFHDHAQDSGTGMPNRGASGAGLQVDVPLPVGIVEMAVLGPDDIFQQQVVARVPDDGTVLFIHENKPHSQLIVGTVLYFPNFQAFPAFLILQAFHDLLDFLYKIRSSVLSG